MTVEDTSKAWIVRTTPNPGAQMRLFCFSYAGGAASVFYPWPKELPPNVEVCAIQLPGRASRMDEAPFTQLVPLVGEITRALDSYLDKPFAIFGHSMGALVGFEVARRLRSERNVEPAHLFASACKAPQSPPGPQTYNLPEPLFIEELRRINGTPQEVFQKKELMQLMIPILRADFEVTETYTYTADLPFARPISCFGGLQDSDIGRKDLEAWREQTTGSFKLRMFPGDHFFLLTQAKIVLELISRELYRI